MNKKKSLFNEIGCKGWNAVHAAIVKEQKEILSFFIKKFIFFSFLIFIVIFRNADFNIPTVGGWTPLMLTINLNNMECFYF